MTTLRVPEKVAKSYESLKKNKSIAPMVTFQTLSEKTLAFSLFLVKLH